MPFRSQARAMILQLLGKVLSPQHTLHDPPRRILVMEPGHLGDILLLTPALTALRMSLPDALITVMVGPWGRRLLAGNPDLDVVLTCPFPGFVRGRRSRLWEPYALVWKYAALIRAGNFDTAIVARDDHWWGGLLAVSAGIPRRLGMAHPLLEPLLSTALPYDPKTHVTQQRLELVGALSDRPVPSTLQRFILSDSDRAWAEAWRATVDSRRPVVAIQPGSGGPAKFWPTAAWVEVATVLQTHATIILTGGDADVEVIRPIAEALEQAGIPYERVVGEANLGQLAALFSHCDMVLGVDNGPLHLAVAQATPTIHLFGPGDADRFGPWGDPTQHQVVREPLWCAPCGVLSHCPRQTAPSECMVRITPQHVTQRAVALLSTVVDPQKLPSA